MPSQAEGSNHIGIYEPNTKSFGEKAERLDRNELFSLLPEILQNCRNYFPRVEMLIPLEDKETFGDIDLVIISDTPPDQDDEQRMRQVFGRSLIAYHHQKNDKMDSLSSPYHPAKRYRWI